MIPASILIASVLLLMLATTCTVAFVHGWQDGPDSHTHDRHAWIPRAFYETGWRVKRHRLTAARRELEQERRDRDDRTARFYAALDRAVQDELASGQRRAIGAQPPRITPVASIPKPKGPVR